MKNFFVILRDDGKENLELVERIKEKIIKKGGTCEFAINPDDEDPMKVQIPKDVQMILTIGGDGTLIRSAQNTFGSNVPLLGINCGHLGYLCDLDPVSVFPAIDRLMEDDFEMESRMMLSGYIEDENGNKTEAVQALNDIVICSAGGLQVIMLTVYVNGQYLFSYSCDGIIISTPTGSTAYNLSAHGPIANPETELIILTPINPHTLNARCIILDPLDEVSVTFTPRYDEKAEVGFDGNHKQPLIEGNRLVVSKAKQQTQMIRLHSENFLERIRSKMQAE